MNRKLLLALIALLLVCICVVVTGGAGMLIYLSRDAFVFAPPTDANQRVSAGGASTWCVHRDC